MISTEKWESNNLCLKLRVFAGFLPHAIIRWVLSGAVGVVRGDVQRLFLTILLTTSSSPFILQNAMGIQDPSAKDKVLQSMASMSSAQIVSASAIHNKAVAQGLAGIPPTMGPTYTPYGSQVRDVSTIISPTPFSSATPPAGMAGRGPPEKRRGKGQTVIKPLLLICGGRS